VQGRPNCTALRRAIERWVFIVADYLAGQDSEKLKERLLKHLATLGVKVTVEPEPKAVLV
jgi:hypothetical protein